MMTDLLQPFSIIVFALKLLISTTEYDQGIATLERWFTGSDAIKQLDIFFSLVCVPSILVNDSQKLQPFVEHLISNLQ